MGQLSVGTWRHHGPSEPRKLLAKMERSCEAAIKLLEIAVRPLGGSQKKTWETPRVLSFIFRGLYTSRVCWGGWKKNPEMSFMISWYKGRLWGLVDWWTRMNLVESSQIRIIQLNQASKKKLYQSINQSINQWINQYKAYSYTMHISI